jgi:hypothetical protein
MRDGYHGKSVLHESSKVVRRESMPIWSVAAAFGAAVLVFDAVAASIAQKTGGDYRVFGVGSILLYAGCGAVAALSTEHAADLTAAISAPFEVGLLIGVIDSTIGWGISAVIGPGRLANTTTRGAKPISTLRMVIRGLVVTVGVSSFCALLAGLLAWVIAR